MSDNSCLTLILASSTLTTIVAVVGVYLYYRHRLHRNEIGDLQAELNLVRQESKQSTGKLKQELASCKSAQQSLQSRLESTALNLRQTNKELSSVATRHQQTVTLVAAVESEKGELQLLVTELQRELESVRDEYSTRMNHWKSQKTDLFSTISTLESKLLAEKKRVSKLSSASTTPPATELDRWKHQRTQLESERNAALVSAQTLQEQNRKLSSIQEEMQTREMELKAELECAKSDNARLESEKLEMQNSHQILMDEHRIEKERIEGELERLSGEFQALESAALKLVNQSECLIFSLDDGKKNVDYGNMLEE